jgi:hypothetical protein
MTNFAQFYKEHHHQFPHLPASERMKECGKLYREMNGTTQMATKKNPQMTMKMVVTKPSRANSSKGGNLIAKNIPSASTHGGNFWQDFSDGIDGALSTVRNIIF